MNLPRKTLNPYDAAYIKGVINNPESTISQLERLKEIRSLPEDLENLIDETIKKITNRINKYQK